MNEDDVIYTLDFLCTSERLPAHVCAEELASAVGAVRVERDSLATQLEQMRRERDEARSDRDSMAQELGDARADLAEARATNARLHRRAQGVEAGKPEDEETIRRLRAEVRAMAKHNGYVAGCVYRLQMATNFAQHATSEAVRERDEARAELADLRARGVVPDADCTCGSGGHPRPCAKHPHRMEMHAREIDMENALDEARAKLARVREVAVRYHMSSERALRIIDEEGGQ